MVGAVVGHQRQHSLKVASVVGIIVLQYDVTGFQRCSLKRAFGLLIA